MPVGFGGITPVWSVAWWERVGLETRGEGFGFFGFFAEDLFGVFDLFFQGGDLVFVFNHPDFMPKKALFHGPKGGGTFFLQ